MKIEEIKIPKQVYRYAENLSIEEVDKNPILIRTLVRYTSAKREITFWDMFILERALLNLQSGESFLNFEEMVKLAFSKESSKCYTDEYIRDLIEYFGFSIQNEVLNIESLFKDYLNALNNLEESLSLFKFIEICLRLNVQYVTALLANEIAQIYGIDLEYYTTVNKALSGIQEYISTRPIEDLVGAVKNLLYVVEDKSTIEYKRVKKFLVDAEASIYELEEAKRIAKKFK